MKRRHLVSVTGLGVLVGLSGCAGALGRTTPIDMAVETEHWSERVLEFQYPERPEDHQNPDALKRDDNPYTIVLTDESEAKGRLLDRDYTFIDETVEFIQRTDFEQSYLVVVDWRGSSSSDTLKLNRINRTEDGLYLDIRLEQPATRLSDLSPHTLITRVTDERESIPENVSAGIHKSEVHRWIERLSN